LAKGFLEALKGPLETLGFTMLVEKYPKGQVYDPGTPKVGKAS